MNTFPLKRVKWSNEHIMAAVLLTLILYHIPQWVDHPSRIASSLLLIAGGLLLDAAANLLIHKRIWCCVSAAVTAAIISLLSPGVPLWGQFVGLAAALVFGKYIWGGTGKNGINPAMLGLLVILLFWEIPYPVFIATYLLIPAAVLSLLFCIIRPYASIGFILGMVISLLVQHNFSLRSLLAHGIFFWGCIVITDPVTITRNRYVGLIAGLLGGFTALNFYPHLLTFVTVVFVFNLITLLTEEITGKSIHALMPKLKIPKAVSLNNKQFIDLSGDNSFDEEAELGISEMSQEEILRNIKYHDVYGMGGAAFSTYQKLVTVLSSNAKNKHLIVNGVECDPGLIHDRYILLNYQEEIKKGIEILKQCVDFASVQLAVKSNEGLELPDDISLKVISNQYPAGAERLLIKEILNLRLDKEQIPAECGILVLNVQTVWSIYRAIFLNKPADTRLLTVANLKDNTAQVVKVRLGMKLKDIMEAVYPGSFNVFAGGGIMQAFMAQDDSVVNENVNFIATGAFPKFKESPQCSQCGFCVNSCPAGLRVNKIAELVDQGKAITTSKYHPTECIGCGSCSYVCLAGRNLSDRVKKAKEAVKTAELRSEAAK